MKNAGKHVSLFLVELIIDLALFVICAAVCVGLLVHARAMSRESARLTEAVYIAQSAAESWRAGAPVQTDYFANGRPDASTLDPVLKSTLPDYTVAVAEAGDRALISVRPWSAPDGEPIYTLTVGRGAPHGS